MTRISIKNFIKPLSVLCPHTQFQYKMDLLKFPYCLQGLFCQIGLFLNNKSTLVFDGQSLPGICIYNFDSYTNIDTIFKM